MYICFFLSSTFTTIPYDAFAPEITDNYDSRTRLFFVYGIYDGVGTLSIVMFYALARYLVGSPATVRGRRGALRATLSRCPYRTPGDPSTAPSGRDGGRCC